MISLSVGPVCVSGIVRNAFTPRLADRERVDVQLRRQGSTVFLSEGSFRDDVKPQEIGFNKLFKIYCHILSIFTSKLSKKNW